MGHDLFVRGGTVVAGSGAHRGHVDGHTHEHPAHPTESEKPRILHAGVAGLYGLETAGPQ